MAAGFNNFGCDCLTMSNFIIFFIYPHTILAFLVNVISARIHAVEGRLAEMWQELTVWWECCPLFFFWLFLCYIYSNDSLDFISSFCFLYGCILYFLVTFLCHYYGSPEGREKNVFLGEKNSCMHFFEDFFMNFFLTSFTDEKNLLEDHLKKNWLKNKNKNKYIFNCQNSPFLSD